MDIVIDKTIASMDGVEAPCSKRVLMKFNENQISSKLPVKISL